MMPLFVQAGPGWGSLGDVLLVLGFVFFLLPAVGGFGAVLLLRRRIQPRWQSLVALFIALLIGAIGSGLNLFLPGADPSPPVLLVGAVIFGFPALCGASLCFRLNRERMNGRTHR